MSTEPLPDNYEVVADDASDSAFGSDYGSNTTSISSSMYAGYVENGRRYQTMREGEYFVPSDEKQFEAENSVHLMHAILDSGSKNPLFRAPVEDNVQNILDIGTGNGRWAIEAADNFPGAVVHGVDLNPIPETWVPPNCIFTVDDLLKTWMFETKNFDFIHIRWLYGALTDSQWEGLYKQAYENTAPGGWIEQVEPDVHFYSDDGTMPADSVLAKWGDWCIDACNNAGRTLNVCNTMKSSIEAAGFTNVHTKEYKVPYGDWTKHKLLKQAGRFNKLHFEQAMEGYTMFIQTRFGLPQPWSPEEVQAHLAKARNELGSGWHTYLKLQRVWAQKPLDAK